MIVDTLTSEHRDRSWTDRWGNHWWYSTHHGWIRNHRARFGGWNPDNYGPFSQRVELPTE